MPDEEENGVTVIVTEQVTDRHQSAFEEELAAVVAALAAMPGNLGVNVIRPENGKGPYHLIYKFDTRDHLERWRNSEAHLHWCERKCVFTATPPSVHTLSGLETWFSLPGPVVIPPPPKYKMAVVSWCAIFPIISVLLFALMPVLTPFPLPLRGAVIAAVAILLMTYLMMPLATRVFQRWLYPALPTVIADEEVPAPQDSRTRV